jgi:hypothetical protein
VKHVIQALIFPGAFQCRNILWTFYHADHRPIPFFLGANRTKFLIRQILTARTIMDISLGRQKGIGKSFYLFCRARDNGICQTLSGFEPDPGKLGKFLCQKFQGQCVIVWHFP